jgi:3-oxoacyl-[acyl-carrier protein] reductase
MSGAIINLSSTAALTGLPDAPHYSAAKAGVIGFSRAVAREVGSRNIRVNVLCPGFVETPMTEFISPAIKRASMGSIPLGRWAEPTEIAAAAVFLASDESSYMTGQVLSPNGGLVTL